MEYRYNYLNNFLKNKYGERVLKICVDGGFTCPNRDGKCGTGGCIFCNERGSGERLDNTKSIQEQVISELNYKKDRANKFIVYFQNFSNTYDSIQNLKRKYDEALLITENNNALLNCNKKENIKYNSNKSYSNSDNYEYMMKENINNINGINILKNKIVGLAIATRPDCIDEEIVKLIKSYSQEYYVWVELGLQTTNDIIAKKINRGYNLKQFENALELLNKYEIDVVTHIMIGLPGETNQDIIDIVKFINSHSISGVKIHSTYIVKNTELENLYNSNKYEPITFEYYMEKLIYIITHLRKDIVIHRFTGDPSKDSLVEPQWELHKKKVMNTLNNTLEKEKIYQGIFENQ